MVLRANRADARGLRYPRRMGRLGAARDKHRKWVASPVCTGRYADVHETCALEKLAQLVNGEAEVAIAKPGPDPALIMRFQIHQEHAS